MSAAGAAILGAEGPCLTDEERRFFKAADPFGFILFARNVDTPGQVRDLCAALRDTVGRNAPILIDQEGGAVQRLRPPHWRSWMPPRAQVRGAGRHAAEAMYLRSRIMAHELHDVGVDANCAPLVDLAMPTTHAFLRDRCYATSPARVARIGRAVADGLLAGGVLPVLKHIPGHGRARVDSHFALPRTRVHHATLSAKDFSPFKALSDLPMAMTAHVVYGALDDRPGTLSPVILGLIRDEIGFDGLLMTDDISMKALKGDLAALSRASIEAGCDVVLHCNGRLEEARAVADAAGRLSVAGHRRAEAALAARRAPDEVDIPALEAKLEALMQGR